MTPLVAIYLLWGVWFLSWITARMWVNPTIKRAGAGHEILYRIVMLAGIVGSELMTTIGLTNRYQLFTPEHMMLDDDLYHRAANAFRDLELDEETLALDVIDAVGPGGHFLGQPHTRRHMKETVERSVGQEIGPDGVHYRDPLEVARERGVDILENYEPEPLSEAKAAELRRIVSAADAELRG